MAIETQNNDVKLTEWDIPKELLAFVSVGGLGGVFVTRFFAHSVSLDQLVVRKTEDLLTDPLVYLCLTGMVAAAWLFKITWDRDEARDFPESNIF